MKTINKQEVEQQLEKIGTGKGADIYRNGNEVYKILKKDSDSIRFYSKEMIENLIGVKSELCVFPNEILEDNNGEFLGYSMDFVPGDKMKNVIKKMPFEQLQEAIRKAEEGVKEVSEQGIIFDDMHYDNIMWNDETQSIQITDTDFFKRAKETSIEDIKASNLQKFNREIMQMCSLEIRSYNEDIFTLRNILEKDFGRSFNNIEEMEIALQERQMDIEEQQYEESHANNLSIKEKLIRWAVQNKTLRKIPFVNKIIEKKIKMLPSATQEIKEDSSEKTEREVFCDNLSNNGEYRNLPEIEQRNTETEKEDIMAR